MDTKSATSLKPKVLIADDNESIRELMHTSVCGQGLYRCVLAEDGQDAITKYDEAWHSNDPFDLLILDAAMPIKTGFEVADYVRKDCCDSVPIIIVTAHVEVINDAHSDYVGADAVVYKPFDIDQLQRVLAIATIPRTMGERVASEVIRAAARSST